MSDRHSRATRWPGQLLTRLALLFCGLAPLSAGEAQEPPSHASERELRNAPPPRVSAWTPREKVYPGQRLVITGEDFQTDGFRVTLTGAAGAVELPIRSATSSRIEADITEAMLTGFQGARLSVTDSGGGVRVLEEQFRVLRRDASFQGTSFWRESTSANSGIVARGEVALELDRFEFQELGIGTYSETVRLVRLVREWRVECPTGADLDAPSPAAGRIDRGSVAASGRSWDWRDERVRRQIEWRRLPDGRVELRKIGLSKSDGSAHDALARLDGKALTLFYETTTAGPHARPVEQEPDCGGAEGEATPSQGRGLPGRPDPFRLVEWSLERLDS